MVGRAFNDRLHSAPDPRSEPVDGLMDDFRKIRYVLEVVLYWAVRNNFKTAT